MFSAAIAKGDDVGGGTGAGVAQEPPSEYAVPKLLMLHLAPGIITALIYLLSVPWAMRHGIPPLGALLAAVLVGLLPIEVGHLLYVGRQRNQRWSLRGVVLGLPPWRPRDLVVVLLLVIASIAAYEVSLPLDRVWRDVIFRRMPTWFDFSDAQQYLGYSHAVLVAVFSARLVIDGLVGPIVEELYFRGYLLQRMLRFGWGAPVLNGVLFAAYHFWQPYNLPTIFCISLPMVMAVWKTGNLRLSIWTHVILNLIAGVSALFTVLS